MTRATLVPLSFVVNEFVGVAVVAAGTGPAAGVGTGGGCNCCLICRDSMLFTCDRVQ